MVELLAKNAVKIKCKFPDAIMTGNYECAYALGVMTSILKMDEFKEYNNIIDLKEKIISDNINKETYSDNIKRLFDMLVEYTPTDIMDEQMRKLYSLGFLDGDI